MKLSIVTVNLNNADGLRRTIRSVAGQSAEDIEYIVIDGASTDGSAGIIEEYAESIDYWVSEPDGGIYSAMNKGIRRATGDYCLFLNSGDWLVSESIISEVLSLIDGSYDIYYSDLFVSDCVRSHEIRYPYELDVDYFVSETISHQNSLIRTEYLRMADMYREDFRIAADWFFFIEAIYRDKARFKHLEIHIAFYYYAGRSTSPEFEEIKERERERGIRELFGDIAPSILALNDFRQSLYGSTVRLFGLSKPLILLIRGYRFMARSLRMFRKKKPS